MIFVVDQDKIAVVAGIELAAAVHAAQGVTVEWGRGGGGGVVVLPGVDSVDQAGLVDVVVPVVGVDGEAAAPPVVLRVGQLVLRLLSNI